MIFDGFPGGPGAEHLGLVEVTKQYGVAIQHAKYSIKPAGIKGYEQTRMQTTKIRKIKAAI